MNIRWITFYHGVMRGTRMKCGEIFKPKGLAGILYFPYHSLYLFYWLHPWLMVCDSRFCVYLAHYFITCSLHAIWPTVWYIKKRQVQQSFRPSLRNADNSLRHCNENKNDSHKGRAWNLGEKKKILLKKSAAVRCEWIHKICCLIKWVLASLSDKMFYFRVTNIKRV